MLRDSTLNYRLNCECSSCGTFFYLWDFRKTDTPIDKIKCPHCKSLFVTQHSLKFEVEKMFPKDQPTAGEFVALTWEKDKYLDYVQRMAVRELRIAAAEAADYASTVCREDFNGDSAPFKIISATEWFEMKK